MPKKPQQLAKLSRPRLYDALPRERLFALLAAMRKYPAIWISGPPGAGKTMLVASYLESCEAKCFWYNLDSGDSDPATGFYFFSVLVGQNSRGPKTILPYLTPDYLKDLPGFTRRFFRTFFARMGTGAVLVLDNYHEAECEKLNEILNIAISELPENLNIIVISRTELPAELSRLEAHRVAANIGWKDLKLTADECAAIARASGIRDVSAINSLLARSGGWAAGLTLMLAAKQSGSVPSDADRLDSRKAVFDYFANELLAKTSERNRAVLLQTALFPQFSAQMAAELTGQDDAGAVLDRFYRQHYFTERRAGEPPIYHYHDLFREFLAEKSKELYEPACLCELRRNAGRILLREALPEPAIGLLESAGDTASIARAIESHAEQLLAQGRWQTLVSWCRSAGSAGKSQWVAYWHGLAQGAIDSRAARLILERAYESFVCTGNRTGQALACSAILDSFFQQWETVAELDPWILKMEALLTDYEDMPQQARARALSSMVVSLLHRQPGHPSLPAYAEEAYSRMATTTDANQKYTMASSLIYYYNLRGAHSRANELIALTEPHIDHSDVLPVNAMTWWYRCGLHYLYSGNVQAAVKPCYRALDLVRTHKTGWVGYVSAFMIEITQGRVEAAAQILLESRQMFDPSNRLHLIAIYWLELWLQVVKGEMTQAIALWEEFRRIPVAGVPIHTAFNHAAIYLMVHKGETKEALEKVRHFQALLKDMRSPVIDFNLLSMEAYVQLNAGDAEAGKRALASMMRIGRANELLITLCWVPRMMSYLCGRALEHSIEVDYVQRLILSRNLEAPDAHNANWPRPIKIVSLGQFEIRRRDRPIEFSRKVPRKLVAILKVVIAHGKNGLVIAEMADLLWPDLEADAAQEALATNLHRLRKLLGRAEALRLIDGRISLNDTVCWVDVWAFEELCRECRAAWQNDEIARAPELAERALEIYRGSFLPDDLDQAWSISMRERLRTRFIGLVAEMATHYEKTGETNKALEWFRRGIEADNLAEEFYQGLMRCYVQQGRKAEGAAVYRQLKQLLSVVLGVAPAQATQNLARQILAP
ncbi:MAG TPA: BTAD domain-containing putative transcriptional regulator [Burkholderiales bacterium]